MERCLELAAKGLGKTRSNPMVGAVIVYKNRIIGEGYHHAFGGAHAEDLAVRAVKDIELLKESILFVNLEPCNHFGKTPPCSHLIIKSGIPEVIVGSTDPNPIVSGSGIKYLRENGVKITTGLLENECRFLNRRFYTFHNEKRPYVILKWAQTKDGYLDNREPGDLERPPLRITGDYSRMLVHKWRTEEMAIMAGTNTVNMDNPSLTSRYWPGKNPVRLSFEINSSLRDGLQILTDRNKTIIYTNKKKNGHENLDYIEINQKEISLSEVLNHLYKLKILSVMIEGGSRLLSSFLHHKLWDEARVFKGSNTAGEGVAAPPFNYSANAVKSGTDSLLIVFRKKPEFFTLD